MKKTIIIKKIADLQKYLTTEVREKQTCYVFNFRKGKQDYIEVKFELDVAISGSKTPYVDQKYVNDIDVCNLLDALAQGEEFLLQNNCCNQCFYTDIIADKIIAKNICFDNYYCLEIQADNIYGSILQATSANANNISCKTIYVERIKCNKIGSRDSDIVSTSIECKSCEACNIEVDYLKTNQIVYKTVDINNLVYKDKVIGQVSMADPDSLMWKSLCRDSVNEFLIKIENYTTKGLDRLLRYKNLAEKVGEMSEFVDIVGFCDDERKTIDMLNEYFFDRDGCIKMSMVNPFIGYDRKENCVYFNEHKVDNLLIVGDNSKQLSMFCAKLGRQLFSVLDEPNIAIIDIGGGQEYDVIDSERLLYPIAYNSSSAREIIENMLDQSMCGPKTTAKQVVEDGEQSCSSYESNDNKRYVIIDIDVQIEADLLDKIIMLTIYGKNIDIVVIFVTKDNKMAEKITNYVNTIFCFKYTKNLCAFDKNISDYAKFLKENQMLICKEDRIKLVNLQRGLNKITIT